jgi:hypothetical protein
LAERFFHRNKYGVNASAEQITASFSMNFSGRFLIKASAPVSLGMGAAPTPEFPLFPTATMGAVPEPTEWVVAPLKSAVGEGQNGWDLAHALLASKASVGGAPVEFIEPDFMSAYPFTRVNPATVAFSADEAANTCGQDPPDQDWPDGGSFAWHLGDTFTQLKAARDQVGIPAGAKVRIAHLDTGYSPGHEALPEFLRSDQGRNFVETSNPLSAIDPGVDGFMKNPGHGMGTMGILAGRTITQGAWQDRLGGAPFAEVVPVRIGDSVVHFYSSSMAQGLDYALAAGCRVVTISMGGVPSQAWADAVNRLYEAGVAVFAAAGNNIGGFPTINIVYPARFNRVTAVCGATAAKGPYYKGVFHSAMQGNFGPKAKMSTAIAAYTPNITWPEWGCAGTVDLDGAGTSSATPQVAAAAALWYQHHASALGTAAFTNAPWKRVEALRRALFSTADKTAANSAEYFGNGLLRASDALAVVPDASVQMAPKDEVSWPWIRLLFGVGAAGSGPAEAMLELEMIQLLTMFDELSGEESELMHEGANPSAVELRRIAKRVENSPRASKVLRGKLHGLGL